MVIAYVQPRHLEHPLCSNLEFLIRTMNLQVDLVINIFIVHFGVASWKHVCPVVRPMSQIFLASSIEFYMRLSAWFFCSASDDSEHISYRIWIITGINNSHNSLFSIFCLTFANQIYLIHYFWHNYYNMKHGTWCAQYLSNKIHLFLWESEFMVLFVIGIAIVFIYHMDTPHKVWMCCKLHSHDELTSVQCSVL